MNKYRFVIVAAAVSAAAMGSATTAGAGTLPAVKVASGNAVPACTTPGRLMAYLRARNPSLDPRFETIAVEYMRHGEALGLRWDYGFYQMILETGALAFKRGNGKPGDVRPVQNNFAGLGATGNGEKGESFSDISSGVRAHLEHVLMYSGEHVDNAVAERTRKVQEWGVLTAWHKTFKRPITFSDIGKKWAPGDRSYSTSLESIADKFEAEICKSADPAPHLVELARTQKVAAATAPKAKAHATPAAAAPSTPPAVTSADPDRPSSAELAREALERSIQQSDATRSSLGAGAIAKSAGITKPASEGTTRAFAAEAEPVKPEAQQAEGAKPDPGDKSVSAQTAGPTAKRGTVLAALPKPPVPAAAPAKCRVWTASYGGQKSVIISSINDGYTNYTVLDVNDGAESRETDAYIAAYAKNGQKIADFPNQEQALDQAFKLCPEG